jgi:hypothetical protein
LHETHQARSSAGAAACRYSSGSREVVLSAIDDQAELAAIQRSVEPRFPTMAPTSHAPMDPNAGLL